MKIKFSLFAIILALATWARGATNDLTSLLQKGLFEEEANRDLSAAIANYQSLASAFDKDRQIAATAIFRLGECYRKLGKTNDAVAQYQRIVKEFGDQQTLVTLSRQDLAGLGMNAASTAAPVVATANPGVAEQARQLGWVKKLQTMPLSEVRQVAPTVLTDATLINLIYQDNQTELDLIRLRTDHGEEHPEVQREKAIQAALQDKIKERLQGMETALSMEAGMSVAASTGGGGKAAEPATTDEEQQEIRRIQLMIQNSPDLINAPSGSGVGFTPLITAAMNGQLVVAKYLLDHGANVNGFSQNHGFSPLSAAAQKGHKAMVELLLSRGADVSGGGLNPLFDAVRRGYLAVAEVLLANKADVNFPSGTDTSEMRPLHVAARDGRIEMLQLLLKHDADVNTKDAQRWTPLEYAAAEDNTNAAKLLLASKASTEARDAEGDTPLHKAAYKGNTDMVSLLLDSGAMVDATNGYRATPLLRAVIAGHADTVRVLLEHKADPNRGGSVRLPKGNMLPNWPPVFLAMYNANNDILKLLLDAGASAEINSPIIDAIDKNNVEAVRLLLDHGADPNRLDWDNNPLLSKVLILGKDKRMVPLLLDKGADANARDKDKSTPLARTSDPEIGRWLVEHKADVNARISADVTALMMTSDTNYLRFLLEAGAKPDLQDTNGNTALHHETISSRSGAVAVLLEYRANPNIQNNAGYTPLDLAKSGSVNGVVAGGLWTVDSVGGGVNSASEREIADLLTKAGGLANLPKRNLIQVRRGFGSGVAFNKGAHDWNRYSLLEMIAREYRLLTQITRGDWEWNSTFRPGLWVNSLHFPDFKKVVIYRRTDASAKQTEIPVNVEEILKSGDCSRDVWLEWGDVVEIPEADHPVDEQWRGLTDQTMSALTNCVSRRVTIRIKGEDTPLTLAPGFVQTRMMSHSGEYDFRLTSASFMLRSVLDNSKLVRVSSDLSRVKVTRMDPETKKKLEWTIDCTNPSQADLWLRDGDVIDVPEK